MTDNVNHPSHYERFRFTCEPKDFTKYLPHPLASAVEYVIRAPHKGNELEDLKKARFWLNELLKTDCLWNKEHGAVKSGSYLILPNTTAKELTEYRAAVYGLACKWWEITELIRSLDTPEFILDNWVLGFLSYINNRIEAIENGAKQ